MKYTLSILLFIGFLNASAQERSWEQKMGDPNISFYEIQKDFNEYWGTSEIPSGAGHKPYKRWEYLMETRVDENGFYNAQTTLKEYEKYMSSIPPNKNNNPWTILGPTNQPTGNNGIGRINVINVHPDNPDTIYVGTPAGGLWYTYDDGVTWNTVTDDLESIGVSDIAFDPVDPNIMYIATGDRDHNDTPTTGIMKSTDGGITWSYTNFQPGQNGLPNFYLIHRILVDPTNGDAIIAATTSGVFRSADGGSTWTHTLNTSCIRHMEFKPGSYNTIYGTSSTSYCGGTSNATFYKSFNNGVSWTTTTLPGGGNLDRLCIGVSADSPTEVYLLASQDDSSNSNDFEALYKSTNNGASFTEIVPTHAPSLGSQQWYDWSFTIDPDDTDVMYAGGVHLEKTTDGGLTWVTVTNNGPNNVHVDHHYAQFYGDYVYIGSDGGIWRSDNGASSWDVLNDGLAITQYYRMSNAETDEDIIMAGAQDNGTHQLKNGNWIHEFGGDGMDNAIDPNDKDNLFVSYQYGNFFRSTNGGGSFSSMINSNTTGTSGAWVTPIKIDESNTNKIYVGYDRVWKSVNDGNAWSDPYGQALTSGNSKLQYIDVAPSDGNVIYTTNYSSIWKSTNGGTSWTLLTDPGNSIRWIEIDPADADHVWITSARKIYETTDGGTSWTNITGTLPNIDMNTIVYDANSNDALYVGTDYGVFYQDNASSGWQPFGTGLPNVIVLELDIIESEDKIRAATFGRGVWEADLVPVPCNIDNIVDLGIESCDGTSNTYNRIIEVSYISAPTTGTLDVLNQSFPITSSPQSVLVNLPANGALVNVTATFSDDNTCSLTSNNLFSNPTILTYYADGDNDGFGDANVTINDCSIPVGYVTNSDDCNDNNSTIYPGAAELCDGLINNCNTPTLPSDEVDNDGDGYVECTIIASGWEGSSGVIGGEDCDDTEEDNYPNNTEVCDGIDNDCDGMIDENGTNIYYADTDNDGYGDANNSITGCAAQAGYVTNNTDCDDSNASVYPDAPELCDGIINNCNTSTLSPTEVDNDGDGYVECTIDASGWNGNASVIGGNDCDDTEPLSYPGNTEVCDGIDNNCNNNIDEGLLNTYYIDSDNDGYGNINISVQECSAPSGYVSNNTDCDDSNNNVYPGSTEVCDGIDNNCNNVTDEGCGPPPDCDGQYLVISTITQNSYHAELDITSDALLNNGQSILFTAGGSIELDPPFEVEQGTAFEAKITPCITSSANLILGDDNINSKDLRDLYENILSIQKSTNSLIITLTDIKGQEIMPIDKYESYSQFVQSILEKRKEGIYLIKADSGQDQLIQKVIFIE